MNRRERKRIVWVLTALCDIADALAVRRDPVTLDRAAGKAVVSHLLVRRCRSSPARLLVEQSLLNLRSALVFPAVPVVPGTGPLAVMEEMREQVRAMQVGAAMLAVQAWAGSVPVSGLAMSLVAATVRILPSAERARYLEEFCAELAELRRGQVRHALRLLCHMWSLRRELGGTDEEPGW